MSGLDPLYYDYDKKEWLPMLRCKNCKHWSPNADPSLGKCKSDSFDKAVYNCLDGSGGPTCYLTKDTFGCIYFEAKE